jgi:hypothetical protein
MMGLRTSIASRRRSCTAEAGSGAAPVRDFGFLSSTRKQDAFGSEQDIRLSDAEMPGARLRRASQETGGNRLSLL